MTALITPRLITPEAHRQPDAVATKLLGIAGEVINDSSSLSVVHGDGVEVVKTVHKGNPGLKIEVSARRASSVLFGIKVLFAHFVLSDISGAMSMYLERRRLRSYQFVNDPFARMMLDQLSDHLAARSASDRADGALYGSI